MTATLFGVAVVVFYFICINKTIICTSHFFFFSLHMVEFARLYAPDNE